VKATGESVHERTTHDDHDDSDSEAVPYGAERGKGRAAADEARGVLPANLEYLQAAGVEFLVVSSAADPTKKDKVPAKNQADLLYFSGHGIVDSGVIYNYGAMDHVGVGDIDPAANWADDLDCFTIAGCSVLQIYSITNTVVAGSTASPGVEWANRCLMGRTPGGHLKALCGYYGAAPADSGGVPQQVAAALTSSNASGAVWAQAWKDANNSVVNTYWAAMDSTYYYWHWQGTVLWHDGQEAY